MPENLIATEPLYIGRARAANPGDTVPEENVKRFGWEDQVAKESSRAAKEALGTTTESQPDTAAPAAQASSQAKPGRS